jgi:hypothetical protein
MTMALDRRKSDDLIEEQLLELHSHKEVIECWLTASGISSEGREILGELLASVKSELIQLMDLYSGTRNAAENSNGCGREGCGRTPSHPL